MPNKESKAPKKEVKTIKITSTEEIKKGVFSNQVIIQHSNEIFRLDFITVTPPDGTLNARIFLTPNHFKRFTKALDQNLKKYEKKFGKISEKVEEHKVVH
jgi:hypothetical protein